MKRLQSLAADHVRYSTSKIKDVYADNKLLWKKVELPEFFVENMDGYKLVKSKGEVKIDRVDLLSFFTY